MEHLLAGLLIFHLYSIQGPSPPDGATHIQHGSFTSIVWPVSPL